MVELFSFMIKTLIGVMTVSCGMPLTLPPPMLPPTQERPLHYVCMIEIAHEERYVAVGRFYKLGGIRTVEDASRGWAMMRDNESR